MKNGLLQQYLLEVCKDTVSRESQISVVPQHPYKQIPFAMSFPSPPPPLSKVWFYFKPLNQFLTCVHTHCKNQNNIQQGAHFKPLLPPSFVQPETINTSLSLCIFIKNGSSKHTYCFANKWSIMLYRLHIYILSDTYFIMFCLQSLNRAQFDTHFGLFFH